MHKMMKFVSLYIALICATNYVEALRGTVCKAYDDVAEAGTCSGQTIFVESEQSLIPKSKINQIVKAEIEKNCNSLQKNVETLRKSLENLTQQIAREEMGNPCQPNPCLNGGVCFANNEDYLCKCPSKRKNCSKSSCPDGIIYGNQCITLISCNSVILSKAEQDCSNINATLAEISSVSMYNRVYAYLLSSFYGICSGKSNIYALLGSTFETTNNPNNDVTLRNGTKVQLGNWLPGYPEKTTSSSSWTILSIMVRDNVGSTNIGMQNLPENPYIRVPLCSYNV